MRLNIEDWKDFQVSSVFNVINGKGVTEEEINENVGSLMAIQGGASNNGCLGKISLDYCKEQKYKVIEEYCLTVARVGSAGCVNFQSLPCVVGDKAKALILKENKTIYIYLFMATLLNQNIYKYSYGRGLVTDTYMSEVIKLPICRDENNEPIIDSSKKYSEDGYIPDFEWMENYIKTLKHKPLTTSNGGGTNKLQLDVERWGEFEVVKLFNGYKRGTRITTSDRLSGNYPFVTAGGQNEGVTEKISNIEAITYNNAITIDMFGNSFYHGYDFKADDNILVLKNKTFLNKYIGCFISTVINQDKYKNSYGRQYRQKDCDIHVIDLPICYEDDGETPVIDTTYKYSKEGYIPDFKFMEEYIKSLTYGDRL